MTNAREVALLTVRDVFPTQGAAARGAQESLDYRVRRAELDSRDRAFATELAYGAMKMRRRLDRALERYIGERTTPLAPAIHELLRCAMYELMFTKADEHATVFEWVNLAKKYGHGGLGKLVNAVLRSALRDGIPEPTREEFENDDDFLAVTYSLPTWMVRQWRGVFGAERLEAICAGVNLPAQAALSVNLARVGRVAFAERLAELDIASDPSPFTPETLILGGFAGVRALPDEGSAWFESESSAMAVDILAPQPDERVLDMCSGRGNKTLQIVARTEGTGSVTCIEHDERKIAQMQARLGVINATVEAICADATGELFTTVGRRFDRILLDAPCSATGVIGRHPEARWKKRHDDGARLAGAQKAMLANAIRFLDAGGVLVYSVCSVDPRETTDVIEAILKSQPVQRGLVPARYEPFLTEAGDVLVPPGIEGRDGFFFARLERSA